MPVVVVDLTLPVAQPASVEQQDLTVLAVTVKSVLLASAAATVVVVTVTQLDIMAARAVILITLLLVQKNPFGQISLVMFMVLQAAAASAIILLVVNPAVMLVRCPPHQVAVAVTLPAIMVLSSLRIPLHRLQARIQKYFQLLVLLPGGCQQV
jgi:hypothetical protein